jgi:hypothetical protein
MLPLLKQMLRKLQEGFRIVVPTFAVAGLLVMSRTPDLWAMTDYNGNTNWLPFIVIGCLSVTLVALLLAR